MTPETLAEIHARAFPHAPWDAAAFKGLLDRPTTRLLTRPGGAFLIAQVILPEAEILTLAVPAPLRRQGLAQSMVTELQGWPGVASLHLEVAADNQAARALYEGLGFREIGRRANYYARIGAAPVDALMMRRRTDSN